MQKKIIALAIASALTAPALAFADVTVYGLVDLSIDRVSDGASPSATTFQLNSNNSRVGVKGSEDLGNGLSAIAQLEGTVAMDAGANTGTTNSPTLLFDRDTFLGLSSTTAGTVVLGQHDAPYKMATRKLDVFADSLAADNRGSTMMGTKNAMMGGGHDARPSNMIGYLSPAMSGFSVAVSSKFGAETAAANTTKGSGYSLAGMFEQGPIYATLAYDTIKFGDAGTGDLGATGGAAVDDKATALKVGGSYTMDAFAVNAVIERLTYTVAATGADLKNTNFYLAGKFNISSTDAVKAAFTKRGNTTGATDNAKQYTVGYDHGLSKNTTVYALYTKITQNGSDPITLVDNPDPSAVSVGIKHSF